MMKDSDQNFRITRESCEFYEDMKRRVYMLALNAQFFSQLLAKGRSLRTYGLESMDSQVLFLFFILRFLMEKTLSDEECTIDDIALFASRMAAQLFHILLDEEKAHRIAMLVINEVLCNQGEPICFDPLEEEHGDFQVYLNYVVSSVNVADDTISYRLSEDGLRLLLSSLEMEENMQLQFRDLVFSLELSRRNYSRALEEINSIFQLLKMKAIDMGEKISRIRSNARCMSGAEYRAYLKDNNEILQTTRSKFQKYKEDVTRQIDEIRSMDLSQTSRENERDNLETLKQIQQILGSSIFAEGQMISSLDSFQLQYTEELAAQMKFASARTFALRPMIFEPVMNNPDLLQSIDAYFHPLFTRDLPRQLSLEKGLEFKPLVLEKDGQDSAEWVEMKDEEAMLQMEAQKKERLARWDLCLEKLLLDLYKSSRHTILLSEWLEQEPDAFESVQQAREMLFALAVNDSIDLEKLLAEQNLLIFDEQESFNLPLSLIRLCRKNPQLAAFRKFEIEKAAGKAQVCLQEELGEFTVRIDNLRLSLTEEKENTQSLQESILSENPDFNRKKREEEE